MIERRESFWRSKPMITIYRSEKFEILRPATRTLDLEKELEKFRGGTSRWKGGRRKCRKA